MTSDPKRLTVVGATDLERSLLQAARRERPSPELTARMAAGLGISVAAALTAAAAPAAAAAPLAAAKTTLTAWLVAGAFAAAVATGVVVARRSPAPPTAPVEKAGLAVPAAHDDEAPSAAPASAAAHERRIEKMRKRPAPAQVQVNDLRDQIALIDAARTAVKAGATERALVLLRRYETSYPGGAFRPESLALRIEALAEGGRAAEARPLAREFLARYPQSPLSDRVARAAR